jgi:hypothetical protein
LLYFGAKKSEKTHFFWQIVHFLQKMGSGTIAAPQQLFPEFCLWQNSAPEYSASTQKISILNLRLSCRSGELCPPLGVSRSAQGIGGARSGRASGGTPAKPGFRRSRKCAQMKFCKNLLYLLLFYK